MCNERTERENQVYLAAQKNSNPINRRNFTLLAGGGISTALTTACLGENGSTNGSKINPKGQKQTSLSAPASSAGLELQSQSVSVTTPDGEADCYFTHPKTGAHPAVIIWPDVMGLRAAYRQMADRLAALGFAVLVINPYYRAVKGEVFQVGDKFSDPAVRNRILPYARALTRQTTQTDGRVLVDYLDAQSAVDTSKKIGTLGYCMGGSMTIVSAAHIPERIGAAASFHGGRLATDKPNSPHHLLGQTQAGFLIAIASNDDKAEPEVKNILRKSFDAHNIAAEVEVYAGALHGWCVPGSPVYHEAQAERAWTRMVHLLKTNLG